MNYSQNDEQHHILQHFAGRLGRFLDIGAYDGVRLSNTHALALHGWRGVCVEPSPTPFRALMDTYKMRPDIALVHAAIAPVAILTPFHDARGDFVSTFDEKLKEAWSKPTHRHAGNDYQTIFVPTITARTLVTTLPGPYDFLSLDVEGLNFDIFRDIAACGLRALGFTMMCVEHQEHRDAMVKIAGEQGYQPIHTTPENTLFAKK